MNEEIPRLSENPSEIGRRKFLSAASGAAIMPGLSQIIDVQAAFNRARRIGSAQFVEIEVNYEGIPRSGIEHSDRFPQYYLDTDNGRLLLTNFGRVRAIRHRKELFLNNRGVIHGTHLTPAPTTALGRDPDEFLIVHKNFIGGVIDRLRLAVPQRNPTVRVRYRNGVAIAAIEGEQQEIAPEKTVETVLPDQTLEVLRDKEADDKMKKPNVGETTVKEITVTPVIRVRNNGHLEIFEMESE